MDEEPDALLVHRITTGGAEGRRAEAAMCRRFAPRIRLYGLRHLRSEPLAEDLVQSVLIVVLEAARAGRVEDPGKVDRFMLGTCRNVARRMREAERRTEPTVEEELAQAMTVERELLDISALVRCMGALDGRAKQVVHLSFQEERSAEEMARTLGTTAGNVRVLRHRALASLRRCLDDGARGGP